MAAGWHIELFGDLCARRAEIAGAAGGLVISRFQAKIGMLLAYLAYHRDRAHLRDALVDLLWPECDLPVGRNNLSVSLTWLRRRLEPDRPPGGPATGPDTAVLVTDRTSVRLDPDAVTTDVAEFEAALQAAVRAGSSRERGALLSQAVELYRGELLTGYTADWVLSEREWLAERYFQALRQWITCLEQAGELERALEAARRGLTLDLLREETHGDIMRLYAALGQPAAARRQYHELERLLQQELGTAPAAATGALLREIEHGAVLQPALRSSWLKPAAPAPVVPERREGGREAGGARDGAGSGERLERHEGENRLVTILFTDMCRYVETTQELHPEDAAMLVNRLLQAMVDVLLKYEGQVDRFLGDGLLAVFGAHLAHEDDPERAIWAAIEIREAARRLALEVRAGINTGTAYVGEIGSERHREVSVMGPAVNLAARLQEQAEPGQILVGEVTCHQTRRAFAFSAHSLALKGIARPVAAYTVETALPRPEKTRGLEGRRAPLIGREKELAQLREVLAEALQGRGRMVSLIGEAGVGKSRLVAELKGLARNVGAPTRGMCVNIRG